MQLQAVAQVCAGNNTQLKKTIIFKESSPVNKGSHTHIGEIRRLQG